MIDRRTRAAGTTPDTQAILAALAHVTALFQQRAIATHITGSPGGGTFAVTNSGGGVGSAPAGFVGEKL